MSMRLPSADELEQLEDIGKSHSRIFSLVEPQKDWHWNFVSPWMYRKAMGCQGRRTTVHFNMSQSIKSNVCLGYASCWDLFQINFCYRSQTTSLDKVNKTLWDPRELLLTRLLALTTRSSKTLKRPSPRLMSSTWRTRISRLLPPRRSGETSWTSTKRESTNTTLDPWSASTARKTTLSKTPCLVSACR